MARAAKEQHRGEKHSSGGAEASNVQQSIGGALRRGAWQRHGKVKSRRAQKRKGDAGVGDGKQRTCSASHCPAMEQQRNALVSSGNAKRCLALEWNGIEWHGMALQRKCIDLIIIATAKDS